MAIHPCPTWDLLKIQFLSKKKHLSYNRLSRRRLEGLLRLHSSPLEYRTDRFGCIRQWLNRQVFFHRTELYETFWSRLLRTSGSNVGAPVPKVSVFPCCRYAEDFLCQATIILIEWALELHQFEETTARLPGKSSYGSTLEGL